MNARHFLCYGTVLATFAVACSEDESPTAAREPTEPTSSFDVDAGGGPHDAPTDAPCTPEQERKLTSYYDTWALLGYPSADAWMRDVSPTCLATAFNAWKTETAAARARQAAASRTACARAFDGLDKCLGAGCGETSTMEAYEACRAEQRIRCRDEYATMRASCIADLPPE